MSEVSIRSLPKNEATRAIHEAAAVDANIWIFREGEALIYQARKENPTGIIETVGEAENLLRKIEPDKAVALRRRAQNMFGVAQLLSEGSTIKWTERGETVSKKIGPEVYQQFASERPDSTVSYLQGRVREKEVELRKGEAVAWKLSFGVASVIAVGTLGLAGPVTALCYFSLSLFLSTSKEFNFLGEVPGFLVDASRSIRNFFKNLSV